MLEWSLDDIGIWKLPRYKTTSTLKDHLSQWRKTTKKYPTTRRWMTTTITTTESRDKTSTKQYIDEAKIGQMFHNVNDLIDDYI